MLNVHSATPVDEIDQMIIEELRLDGRLSIPQLAERVGVSRATAYARFDRLVDSGVIEGFEVRAAPAALGLTVAALVTIEAHQSSWQELRSALMEIDGVEWIGVTTGSSDFVVLVRARDLEHLRDVVLRNVLAGPGIRSTNTAVLLDESRRPGAWF